MKPVPPIWVINLPQCVDRRRRITRALEEQGLAFEFLPAVNGEDLSREQLRACYDPSLAVRHTGAQLTVGQIGTALSHANAWRRMLDCGLEELVILEDDAEPTADLLRVLQHRDRLEPDSEIVLLYSGPSRYSIWGQKRICHGYRSVRYVGYVAGAVAYLLRRSGAQKLLEASHPVCVPSDYLTGGWLDTGARMYGVKPHCVHHRAGPTTRSDLPANLPGEFEKERRAYLASHPTQSALRERWSGLWRRWNPMYARKR